MGITHSLPLSYFENSLNATRFLWQLKNGTGEGKKSLPANLCPQAVEKKIHGDALGEIPTPMHGTTPAVT